IKRVQRNSEKFKQKNTTRSLLGIRYLAVFDSVLYFSYKNLIEKFRSSYFHIEDNNSYFLRFYNYILDESSFQNFLLKY
ncbi:MAG: hypothetical protein SOZ42_01545, partial [Candidatus Enterosoma sp.]|nr:hypothetical protein [Candidatus Enterosoma sp.]